MAQYNFYVDGTEVDFSDWEIPNDQVAKTVAELFAWDMSVRAPREIAFNLTVNAPPAKLMSSTRECGCINWQTVAR